MCNTGRGNNEGRKSGKQGVNNCYLASFRETLVPDPRPRFTQGGVRVCCAVLFRGQFTDSARKVESPLCHPSHHGEVYTIFSPPCSSHRPVLCGNDECVRFSLVRGTRLYGDTRLAALLAALRFARYEINFCLVKITTQLSIQTLAAYAKTNAFIDSFKLLWHVFWVDVDQFGDGEVRILTFSSWFVIIVVEIFFK